MLRPKAPELEGFGWRGLSEKQVDSDKLGEVGKGWVTEDTQATERSRIFI